MNALRRPDDYPLEGASVSTHEQERAGAVALELIVGDNDLDASSLGVLAADKACFPRVTEQFRPDLKMSDILQPAAEAEHTVESCTLDQQRTEQLGIAGFYRAEVDNPWVSLNSELRAEWVAWEKQLDVDIEKYYADIGEDPRMFEKPQKHKDEDMKNINPFARVHYDPEAKPAFRQWFKKFVPTVNAIDSLQTVDGNSEIDGVPMDPLSLMNLRLSLDAVGVQNRATIMSFVMSTWIQNKISTGEFYSDSGEVEAFSAACGTAKPTIDAMKKVEADTEMKTHLTAVDKDEDAISRVQQIANKMDFNSIVTDIQDLIMQPISKVFEGVFGSRDKKVNIFEFTGFIEYIKNLKRQSDRPKRFRSGATDLIEQGFDALYEGSGLLFFGNMPEDRPGRNVISKGTLWEKMYTREPEEVLEMLDSIGIPRSWVNIFSSNDDGEGGTIYYLYAIDKPKDQYSIEPAFSGFSKAN